LQNKKTHKKIKDYIYIYIDRDEAADLEAKQKNVTKAIKALSAAFKDMRNKFGKLACKELVDESISCSAFRHSAG